MTDFAENTVQLTRLLQSIIHSEVGDMAEARTLIFSELPQSSGTTVFVESGSPSSSDLSAAESSTVASNSGLCHVQGIASHDG